MKQVNKSKEEKETQNVTKHLFAEWEYHQNENNSDESSITKQSTLKRLPQIWMDPNHLDS